MNEDKTRRSAVITVLCIFVMGQCPGSIDAAISTIAAYFKLSSTAALYVTSVASIVCVVSSIAVGFLAGRKVPFRAMVLFCATVELIGSLLPFFADRYGLILILRALFGVGIGAMMSLGNSIAALVIAKERRPFVLGIAMFCGFGGNCLMQLAGGILADIRWNYVFLTHLFLVIPFLLLWIFCPSITVTADRGRAEKKGEGAFGRGVLGLSAVMGLVGLVIAPILIGCSFLAAAIHLSATIAGLVAVCFSLGCMIGGLLFSSLYRLFKRYCISAALIFTAGGVIGSAMAMSIPALCLLVFLGGIGFSLTQTSVMMAIGLLSLPQNVALSSSLVMSVFNLGMFLSSQFESAIGLLTGDTLYMPLYIGGGIYVVIALILLVFNPFLKPGADGGGSVCCGESKDAKA